MPEWTSDIEVDQRLAASLIAEQFPSLGRRPPIPLGQGWDNAVFVVDGRWTFRFPRRAIAVPGVEREIAVLPWLASRVSLPIPRPEHLGLPSERYGYPWPFYGARYLAGREAAETALRDQERASLAAPLGAFLHQLHAIALAPNLMDRLPTDPNRRADMPYRVRLTRARLEQVEAAGLWKAQPSVHSLLDEALGLPASRPTALVHGDLHARHLILDTKRSLAGVIDWGDLAIADPAIDLVLLWSLIPPRARDSFVAAYGSISRPMAIRSRVLAVFLSATLAFYGQATGNRPLARESVASLDRAMLD